jgi:hypothetical protein
MFPTRPRSSWNFWSLERNTAVNARSVSLKDLTLQPEGNVPSIRHKRSPDTPPGARQGKRQQATARRGDGKMLGRAWNAAERAANHAACGGTAGGLRRFLHLRVPCSAAVLSEPLSAPNACRPTPFLRGFVPERAPPVVGAGQEVRRKSVESVEIRVSPKESARGLAHSTTLSRCPRSRSFGKRLPIAPADSLPSASVSFPWLEFLGEIRFHPRV